MARLTPLLLSLALVCGAHVARAAPGDHTVKCATAFDCDANCQTALNCYLACSNSDFGCKSGCLTSASTPTAGQQVAAFSSCLECVDAGAPDSVCLASSEVNDIGDGSPPQPLVGGSNGTSNDTDTCGCSAALSACVGSAQCTTAFACISAAVENGTCSSFVDCASCTSSLNGFDSSLLGNYTECIVCTALQALNSTANATTWAPYTTLNATDVPSTTINATADYGNCSFCASGCNRNEDCYFALKCFFSGGDYENCTDGISLAASTLLNASVACYTSCEAMEPTDESGFSCGYQCSDTAASCLANETCADIAECAASRFYLGECTTAEECDANCTALVPTEVVAQYNALASCFGDECAGDRNRTSRCAPCYGAALACQADESCSQAYLCFESCEGRANCILNCAPTFASPLEEAFLGCVATCTNNTLESTADYNFTSTRAPTTFVTEPTTTTTTTTTTLSRFERCERRCASISNTCGEDEDCDAALQCATDKWEAEESCNQRCVLDCGPLLLGQALRNHLRASQCYQNCLGLQGQARVFTIRARFTFRGPTRQQVIDNLNIIKQALENALGFTIVITGTEELTSRRRAAGDVVVNYEVQAAGDSERQDAENKVGNLDTGSVLTSVQSSYSGGGANPFSSASGQTSQPQSSATLGSSGGDDDDDDNSGVIAGAVVGSVLAVALLAGLAFYVHKSKASSGGGSRNKISTLEAGDRATVANPTYTGSSSDGAVYEDPQA